MEPRGRRASTPRSCEDRRTVADRKMTACQWLRGPERCLQTQNTQAECSCTSHPLRYRDHRLLTKLAAQIGPLRVQSMLNYRAHHQHRLLGMFASCSTWIQGVLQAANDTLGWRQRSTRRWRDSPRRFARRRPLFSFSRTWATPVPRVPRIPLLERDH